MQLDFSTDYLSTWDNAEAVTFGSLTRAGLASSNLTTCPIAVAKRGMLTLKELAASNGAYTAQDRKWLIPTALLPGTQPRPKPGDKVIDGDGVIWTALGADHATLTENWILIARDLVLAYALRDVIDIQRATVTYDSAGGAVRTWPTDATNPATTPYPSLLAKVQLLTQETQEVFGVLGLQGNYAVTVAQDVTIAKYDRIAWRTPGGVVYLDILGQHNPQRIDELPVLDCQLLP